jgi:hypothetical protein
LGHIAEVYTWKEGYILKLFHEWFPSGEIEHEARITGVVQEAGLKIGSENWVLTNNPVNSIIGIDQIPS